MTRNPSSPNTDNPSSQNEKPHFSKDEMLQKMKGLEGSFGETFHTVEGKIKHLPIHKKTVFVSGIVLVFLSILILMGFASLSALFLFLIAVFLFYISFSSSAAVQSFFPDNLQVMQKSKTEQK